MASKITSIIPSQRFETIRDAIGLIIKEEFVKQKALTGNVLFDADVYIERSVSFDASTELPAVNVCFKEVLYSEKDIDSRLGSNIYTIEVTTKAHSTTTANDRADLRAATSLHKLLGAIAYILSSAEYLYLGFTPSSQVIKESLVKGIKIYPPDPVYNPTQSTDALSVVSGMVSFQVVAPEVVTDLIGIQLQDIFTNFTIEDTNKGFKIEIINT